MNVCMREFGLTCLEKYFSWVSSGVKDYPKGKEGEDMAPVLIKGRERGVRRAVSLQM